MSNIAIVIGAKSTIGNSIIEKLAKDETVDQVVAISRGGSPQRPENEAKVRSISCNYSEESIKGICESLKSTEGAITQVIICNGILHTDRIFPEKRLEDISCATVSEVMHINTIIPLLWLANIGPMLKSRQTCKVAILSARVGSISDNRSGGWYAYRASKAALNMLIKTASIEFRRRAPNVKIIAFHPGTTDTKLSKPFQRSVSEGKLFTPDFVAGALLKLLKKLEPCSEEEFFDWNGQRVPW